MTFEEYQKQAVSFRTETANNEEYLTLGLIAEVGEAAGKLAKRRRDGVFDEKAYIKELGDILWFIVNAAEFDDKRYDTQYSEALKDCFEQKVIRNNRKERAIFLSLITANSSIRGVAFDIACLAGKYGYTLEQVAEINIAKLRDRQARGVIKGNGDER